MKDSEVVETETQGLTGNVPQLYVQSLEDKVGQYRYELFELTKALANSHAMDTLDTILVARAVGILELVELAKEGYRDILEEKAVEEGVTE